MSFDFNTLLSFLRKRNPFSFSRFGDGEWFAILRRSGSNCDGHTYFPSMGKALKRIVLSSPPYYTGLQSKANRFFESNTDFQILKHKNKWVDADILHNKNAIENLEPFLQH